VQLTRDLFAIAKNFLLTLGPSIALLDGVSGKSYKRRVAVA